MSPRYAWNDDPATFPVLVVGRSYRHRKAGKIKILARIPSGKGCRYLWAGAGARAMGEQDDFALLNQLTDLPGVERQLALL